MEAVPALAADDEVCFHRREALPEGRAEPLLQVTERNGFGDIHFHDTFRSVESNANHTVYCGQEFLLEIRTELPSLSISMLACFFTSILSLGESVHTLRFTFLELVATHGSW